MSTKIKVSIFRCRDALEWFKIHSFYCCSLNRVFLFFKFFLYSKSRLINCCLALWVKQLFAPLISWNGKYLIRLLKEITALISATMILECYRIYYRLTGNCAVTVMLCLSINPYLVPLEFKENTDGCDVLQTHNPIRTKLFHG